MNKCSNMAGMTDLVIDRDEMDDIADAKKLLNSGHIERAYLLLKSERAEIVQLKSLIEQHLYSEQSKDSHVNQLRDDYLRLTTFDQTTSRRPVQKRYVPYSAHL